MKRMPAKDQSGFTLLELMITLSVAAILATLAYPSMRDFMRRNRAVEQSNGMQSNLQYARGQAAATRSYVSICPMVAGGTQACDVGATYNNGWLIYTATAPNTAYDASVAGSLQLAVPAPTNTSIIANTAGVLTYNALGELLTPGEAQPGINVNFDTCAEDNSGSPMNTVAVPGIQLAASNNGRIASSQLVAGTTCTPL
jgi:type IV fimbrial biogenesis protein FimT